MLTSRLTAGRFTCGGEQILERASRARFPVRVAQQARGVVIGEDDAVQIVRELLGVDGSLQVPFSDRTADGPGNDVEPSLLQFDEPGTSRTVAIVEFHSGLNENAAARRALPPLPIEPSLEERADALLPARCFEGRTDDRGHEPLRGRIE